MQYPQGWSDTASSLRLSQSEMLEGSLFTNVPCALLLGLQKGEKPVNNFAQHPVLSSS